MDFRTQVARDLYHVMSGPSLLRGDATIGDVWCANVVAQNIEKLRAVDENPQLAEQYVAERLPNRRLGMYFEALVSFWLEGLLGMKGLRQNVQVRKDGITVGAYDFLFTDPAREESCHWEVAVKFYYYDPATRLYYGAYTRDRLDLKIDKLINHQLKLAEHLDDRSTVSKIFAKGMLFYPHFHADNAPDLPASVSPTHARGWWVHKNDLARLHPDSRWLPLAKPLWLSPAIAAPDQQLLDRDALAAYCADKDSVVISEIKDGREISRGAVLPDGWPHQIQI